MSDQVNTPVNPLNYVPVSHALGHRISIVGGGGKSSLAKAVAMKCGTTYIELDALFWKPNWVESSAEELIEKFNVAIDVASEGWVADGQYWSKIGGLAQQQADMVVWLDLPWRVMFFRIVKRSFQRAWDKNKICGDNTESWRLMFSRDALWLYWIKNRQSIIHREEVLRKFVPPTTPVVRLKSARELDQFYKTHDLIRMH